MTSSGIASISISARPRSSSTRAPVTSTPAIPSRYCGAWSARRDERTARAALALEPARSRQRVDQRLSRGAREQRAGLRAVAIRLCGVEVLDGRRDRGLGVGVGLGPVAPASRPGSGGRQRPSRRPAPARRHRPRAGRQARRRRRRRRADTASSAAAKQRSRDARRRPERRPPHRCTRTLRPARRRATLDRPRSVRPRVPCACRYSGCPC